MTGQTISHYEILEKLGEGGMGLVYKARDRHLDRFVAIKVLPVADVADPARKARFVQEAKLASALNHPGIVHIYDIASDAGTDFIAMEYVAGKTLDQLIPQKGMNTSEALTIALQIADALARAHAAGIIHRDLKPSNIMVDEHGRVKVLDFGLAKLTEHGLSGDGGNATTAFATEEGTIVGTVSYMSPEQAEGKKLDERSDIFSFGALVYEMVTGKRAFQGDSRLAILSAILRQDPPAMEGVPAELERVVNRCMRKDTERRARHIDDVRLALQELKENSDSATVPSAFKEVWKRRIPVAAAIMVPALVAAGFFAWYAWDAPASAEPARALTLTTFPGQELYPSLSPDGNHVAYTWTGARQDNPDIYVQQIGAGAPLRLTTDSQSDYNPVWSPDGRWIAFLRADEQPLLRFAPLGRSEVRLVAPLGGPERVVTEIRPLQVDPTYLTWCPDSRCLVVTDSLGEGKPDALFVVSLETGERRRLTSPSLPVLGDSDPAVSPDGRSMVFRRNLAYNAGELYSIPLGTGLTAAGDPRRLTGAALDARHPAWMTGMKDILFSARGSLWKANLPGGGPPARLPFVGEDGSMPVVSRPQAGRPGRLVYLRAFEDSNVWRVETSARGTPSSTPPVVTIASTRGDDNPQLSPDGRRVAFVSNRSGESEIWLADADGSQSEQLTQMSAPTTGTPRWSPDGQRIAFDSNLEGKYEIYVIAVSGGKPVRLTSHPANNHVPSFSTDGKWVYFSSNRSGDYQIWKAPATGGEAVQVTHNVGFVAFESPDGQFLYYTQTSGAPSALWRLPTSGGQPAHVLDGVIVRSFAVIETGIYYLHNAEGETRLQFFAFATNTSLTVARNLGRVRQGLTASSDGLTILYSRADSSVTDLMLVEGVP